MISNNYIGHVERYEENVNIGTNIWSVLRQNFVYRKVMQQEALRLLAFTCNKYVNVF